MPWCLLSPGVALSPSHCSSLLGTARQCPRTDLQVPLTQEHPAHPEACEDCPLEAGRPALEEAHLVPLQDPEEAEEPVRPGPLGLGALRSPLPCAQKPAGSLGSKMGKMGVQGLLPSLRLTIYTRDEKNEPLGF